MAHRSNTIRRNAFGTGSTIELMMQSCFQYIPESWLVSLIAKMPGETMNQIRENRTIVHRLARGWITDKSRALEVGKGHRDIMTLLGNRNGLLWLWSTLMSPQSRRTIPMTQRRDFPNTKWSPKYGQRAFSYISASVPDSVFSTLLLAGHETTSNAMSIMLWELAKHQDVRARLRREIASARAANGGAPLTAEDLDNMPYLQAVVKVHEVAGWYIQRLIGYLTGTLPFPPSRAPHHAQVWSGRCFAALRTH